MADTTQAGCSHDRNPGSATRPWGVAGALVLTALVVLAQPRAQAAPQVSSVTPANGATGVAVTSSLVFVFDQLMDTSVAILPSVPPFLVGNLELGPAGQVAPMDCEWGDERTLTCTPTSDLPANTTVTWKLNPAGALVPITSQDGTPLATVSGSFTTGSGGNGGNGGGETAPILLASNPDDGATDVPVSASVVFVFDQAMQKTPALGGFPPLVVGAVAWSGTGVTAAQFSYTWSGDGETLTCDYAGDLPGNTTVSWVLNPPGAVVLLENEAGEPLASGTYAGSFTTGEGNGGGDCDPDGVPESWGGYYISKAGNYVQTSASDPAPESIMPFMFYAGVASPEAGPAVTGGSLTLPNNTSKTLQGVAQVFFHNENFTNETTLDAAYPAGNYTLRFNQSGEPERVIPMAMTASSPPVPKVANYAEAQAVNAAQDFTLRWNPFTGAGADDFLSLFVTDGQGHVVFQAPDFCVPRELPVTATSIVLPAGTFQTDRTYQASLNFARGFYSSTNAVANMAGFGSLSKSTDFTIKTGTGGTTAQPARFSDYQLRPNGDPQMTLMGTALSSYTVQRTGSLLNPTWQNVGTVTMSPAGMAIFQDTQAGKTLPLFYRAVAN